MNTITIIGVGHEKGQLTLDAIDTLLSGAAVYLHTGRCGCADWLNEKNIPFTTLDDLYEEYEDFDEHAEAVADRLLEAAEETDIVYAVFDVRDRTVPELTRRAADRVRVIAGPPLEGALMALLDGETVLCEASDWESLHLTADTATVIREMDSRELAAEIKLCLEECYPDEAQVYLLSEGHVLPIMLYELDRQETYNHKTCVLVPAEKDLTRLTRYGMEHLEHIMRRLLAPGGCPWDRKQTHESLRPYIIEEAYEVVDCIDSGDTDHLYDELGDMLFQIAFHTELGRIHGEFSMRDVTSAICEKMISRHTHIFGNDCVTDADSVADLWSRNKMLERGQTTYTETLKEITKALPATARACKAVKRCETALRMKEDPEAALRDTRALLALGIPDEAALGEVMLALMRAARALGLDPELSLNGAVDRLIDRFEAMEKGAECPLDSVPDANVQEYWDAVKLPKSIKID